MGCICCLNDAECQLNINLRVYGHKSNVMTVGDMEILIGKGGG